MARELGEQLYTLAQHAAAPAPRLEAHDALGSTLYFLGDYAAARAHLEQGIALTDPAAQRALALRHDVAPGVQCLAFAALTLWCLGYPAQAMRRSQEALALAQELAHPHSLAWTQNFAAWLHHRRREAPAVQAQAEALLTLATAQGFPLLVAYGTCWRGWALAAQGQGAAGLAQIHQGLTALLAMGQTLARPLCLALLAEAAGHSGQVEEGLRLLAEALAAIEVMGRGELLAETYRLQGELRLRQAVPDAAQAEACFHQALAIARGQQAKSWELRAAMSLSRLLRWETCRKREHGPQGDRLDEEVDGGDQAPIDAIDDDPCDQTTHDRGHGGEAHGEAGAVVSEPRFQIGDLMGEEPHLCRQAKRKRDTDRPEVDLPQGGGASPRRDARGWARPRGWWLVS
jgi:tetratricopeptide (TPR) repeat protein